MASTAEELRDAASNRCIYFPDNFLWGQFRGSHLRQGLERRPDLVQLPNLQTTRSPLFEAMTINPTRCPQRRSLGVAASTRLMIAKFAD
jgi:hypothetical protein